MIIRTKTCKICGRKFSIDGNKHNPYKMCVDCRAKANDEFNKLAREIYKK
jgi:hypothetical protein